MTYNNGGKVLMVLPKYYALGDQSLVLYLDSIYAHKVAFRTAETEYKGDVMRDGGVRRGRPLLGHSAYTKADGKGYSILIGERAF